MKSSRSLSSKISSRNARRLMSESSDDSANVDEESMDSARAEKVFSRRRLTTASSDDTRTHELDLANKTLMRLSTDSESSHSYKNNNKHDKTTNLDNSMNRSSVKTNIAHNYRNMLQSSDDESDIDVSNSRLQSESSSSILESDQSFEDDIVENNQNSSKYDTDHESFFIPPKSKGNKQRLLSDSSSENDELIKSNNIVNEIGTILVSDSDVSLESKRPSSGIVESDLSVVDDIVEASQNYSKHDTHHEPFSITHKSKRNKQRIFSDSSSENDELKISIKSNKKEVGTILVSDSDVSLESKRPSSGILESDLSVVDDIVEASQNYSKHDTHHEPFSITHKSKRNKQRIFSDSSSENDELKISIKSNKKEVGTILISDFDDTVHSSKKLFPKPNKKIVEESKIETKLKDLSLVEFSDSDSDIPAHFKSTITSSKQSRPFFESSFAANVVYSPISQSSILENVNFNDRVNASNVQKNKKIIETINLDDSYPKNDKVLSSDLNPVKTINLTKNEFDVKVNKSSNLPVMTGNIGSLQMEKIKLEGLIKHYASNIKTMKDTMKIATLHLLPDGGRKLKLAIDKEKLLLKDTEIQLKNVLEKLKHFPEKLKLSPQFNEVNPSNIKVAFTKKAAANVDVNAMGAKALNTYRTQQIMTLDVLTSLQKSLESCPSANTLSENPKELKLELMQHQKFAVSWLLWREKQKPHGGVLADDMGLGKTLTMISLILKSPNTFRDSDNEDSDSDDHEDSPRTTIKGGTLIICPSSLISQWQNEIKTKVRSGIIDAVQYYGPNRESSARRLAKKDVVITTYHVVMWDQKNHHNTSPIFQIKWNRIILDEAHTIRNYKSQTSIAVCSILGVNRWALTGTPVHNKETDFYALLKFIKCRPFDDLAVWKRWIGNNDQAGKNRLSLLVKTLMLRRTKAELSESSTFNLPLKTFHTVNVELFKEEKEVYEKVLQFSSTLFTKYLYEKAAKENALEHGVSMKKKVDYLQKAKLDENMFQNHPELDRLFKKLMKSTDIKTHHILVLLLRLRQLCCHPCLMKTLLETETLKVDGISDTANIDLVDNMSRMSIGTPSAEKPGITSSDPIFEETWLSSKIKAVCDMVQDKVLPTDKAIIVSQWPSMLRLIQKQLSQYKIKTELFCGDVPIPLRHKMIEDFNNKGGPKILLLSLTAGGVGLNLVAANHLFLADIHWNPQLEAQACDRIYRVGQTKPVHVYKFICNNTIETSIQSIQEFKLTIANTIFGGCNSIEGSKITLEDLKQIFQFNPNQ